MTLAQLVILHAKIVKALVAAILKYLRSKKKQKLSRAQWNTMLQAIYPLVEEARRESSRLAREFYDLQRAEHVPSESGVQDFNLEEFTKDLEDDIKHELASVKAAESYVNAPQSDGEHRNFDFAVPLAPYKIEWFIEAMEPEFQRFSKEEADDKDEQAFVARVEKEIRGGGRRTTLYAVESDDEALGWARVQGGAESCAWCAMLISRGPVYKSEETASFKAHPHCDCEVMPVFDRNNWEGKEQYEAIEKLWVEKTKGVKGTQAKVNALRRYLDHGDSDDMLHIAA